MPVSRFLVLIAVVIAAAAVTVGLLALLPEGLKVFVVPVVLAVALAVRLVARRG